FAADWAGTLQQVTPAGPTISLDFMIPGTLPVGTTFTRNSVATYFDATGTMQTATANIPRWPYSTATGELRGLLIEETRTNVIKNSTMAGAVAGTPGTNPTFWQVGLSTTGFTQQIVGTGTENGIAYIDYR